MCTLNTNVGFRNTLFVRNEIAVTFKEDWLILDEQQVSLDRYPDRNYVEIAADGARVHARKVIDRRLAEEAGETKKAAEPAMA